MCNIAACFTLLIAAATIRVTQAADFTVTTTNGSGPGSLRQAIIDANDLAGPDRVLFNIPGGGVHVIDVSQNPLPPLFESLLVDGYSQPGAMPNSLSTGNDAIILIQIDGAAATAPLSGLILGRGTTQNGGFLPSNYTIRGLSLTGFIAQREETQYCGQVMINSRGITVGAVDSSVINGNFIGLLPDGETPRANYIGIVGRSTIGGTDPASRNVISGNTGHGVSEASVVQGNYIGTNASGTRAVPNGIGVYGGATIGGAAAGAGNLISGNSEGIHLGTVTQCLGFFTHAPANNVQIKGNLIGVQADGTSPLPNQTAIQIQHGSSNIIGGLEPGAGNVIAFNGAGVNVARAYQCGRAGPCDPPSEGDQILSNSIYGNASFGIDLGSDGPTLNDAGDADSGPNTYQNAPVIENAQIANGTVTITGKLNSTATTEFTLQYFSESLDLLRPVQIYLGSSSITTDADGNAQFTASFPITDTNVSFNMTATSQAGNTSEFSRNAGRMRNVSTRVLVQAGDNAAIVGVIARNARLIVRALGPSLQAGTAAVAGTLPDPILEVYDSTGKQIAVNNDWRDSSSASEVQSLGLAPPKDLEAAIGFYGSGAYTIVVRDAHGSSGVALVEAYSVSTPQMKIAGEAANLSTRGLVGTGDDVMIAGTIVEQLGSSTRIVARALGPSLAAAGVSRPLPDPILDLHDAQGGLIASNDDWRNGQPEALNTLGLAPSNDSEAAIVARVTAGPYTAVVRGKGSSTGVALVELYNLH